MERKRRMAREGGGKGMRGSGIDRERQSAT